MCKIEQRGETCVMDNGCLRAVIYPRLGGKISSLYAAEKGEELLFQNPQGSYGHPEKGADFSQYDASGFDDAFPNIDAEEILYQGRRIRYEDHGEQWTAPMALSVQDGAARLFSENERYAFEKTVRLDGDTLELRYRAKNVSGEDFPCFYTMHCLFQCDEDMRVVFPPEVSRVENAGSSPRLGPGGTVWDFPGSGETDLSAVRPRSARRCEKFYALGSVQQGLCGLVYPGRGITVDVRWDVQALPYLGFWVTEGGFRGDYNCALEPSSGYYDAVSRAMVNRKLWILRPGEEKHFWIRITVR